MAYVVLFLAGALASGSVLVIWYFQYVAQLRQERQSVANSAERLKSESHTLAQHVADHAQRSHQLEQATAAFQAQKVQYDDLVRENNGLKQDLFNLSVNLKKTEREHAAIIQQQGELNQKTNTLGERYLTENVAWIGAKLNPNNFATCKQRLLNVVEACRAIGFAIPGEKEKELVAQLKTEYEEAVRREFEREEQARIRAQIREEEKVARERQKAIQDAQLKVTAKQAARDKIQFALDKAKDAAEIERLTAELAEAQLQVKEAQENSQRAISNAEMTKSGIVYVLSNIGSFGEGVFKVGMTRRDNPQERVDELGSASVPFEYDVHMLLSCVDAPTVETALHRELRKHRINKANFHKEFFRVDLETIRKIAETQPAKVLRFCPEPEAEEYRSSLNTTDEDYEVIEHTHELVMKGKEDADE
jgi:hypothetical protein